MIIVSSGYGEGTSKVGIGKFKEAGLKVVMLNGDNRTRRKPHVRIWLLKKLFLEVMPTQKESTMNLVKIRSLMQGRRHQRCPGTPPVR